MVKTALLVRLEAKPGKEADIEQFLRGGEAGIRLAYPARDRAGTEETARHNGAPSARKFQRLGILTMAAMLGLAEQPDFSHGSPPESSIPQYVHHLYNVTHSLVVFLILFLLVWALVKRPVWELSAWGLHVLMDIPWHSFAFSPLLFYGPFQIGSSTAGSG